MQLEAHDAEINRLSREMERMRNDYEVSDNAILFTIIMLISVSIITIVLMIRVM